MSNTQLREGDGRRAQANDMLKLLQTASINMSAALRVANRMGQRETDMVYPVEKLLRDSIDRVCALPELKGGAS